MYAVVDLGSFQYKITEGEIIDSPKLEAKTGETFDLNEVLLVVDGENVKIGTPHVKGAKVTFEVIRHFRDEKDVKFVYRKRKDWRKKTGHRQELTALKVSKITA